MKTFQEIMFSDLPETIDEYLAQYGTEKMYSDSSIVTVLKDNNLMTSSALETIAEEIKNLKQLKKLDNNNELLKCYVDLECFYSLVESYRKVSEFVSGDNYASMDHYEHYYDLLLKKEWLFEYAEEKNKLLAFAGEVLENIERTEELDVLCENTTLIKCILENFLIDPKEERELETDNWAEQESEFGWDAEEAFERRDINIFGYITESLKKNKFESLLNVYEYVYDKFDENERVQLVEVLKDNESAKNKLVQIIDNHLEDQYDFETLKNLLTKDEEKKKIKLNY